MLNVTPFHKGEMALQRELGVLDRHLLMAPKLIHRELTQQHRDFYPLLPEVFVSSIDASGQIWAGLLQGSPGFAYSPKPSILRLARNQDASDPAVDCLKQGAAVGVLGIEFATRRRNRAHGRITELTNDYVDIEIRQAYGNCPKYIQKRDARQPLEAPKANNFDPVQATDPRLLAILKQADTCLIATRSAELNDDISSGLDVSHRGGRPGFLQADSSGAISFEDYPGNNLFNTIGNLSQCPKAGMTIFDFSSGDVAYLTGEAHVDGSASTERRTFFRPVQAYLVAGRLGYRSKVSEFSPYLQRR